MLLSRQGAVCSATVAFLTSRRCRRCCRPAGARHCRAVRHLDDQGGGLGRVAGLGANASGDAVADEVRDGAVVGRQPVPAPRHRRRSAQHFLRRGSGRSAPPRGGLLSGQRGGFPDDRGVFRQCRPVRRSVGRAELGGRGPPDSPPDSASSAGRPAGAFPSRDLTLPAGSSRSSPDGVVGGGPGEVSRRWGGHERIFPAHPAGSRSGGPVRPDHRDRRGVARGVDRGRPQRHVAAGRVGDPDRALVTVAPHDGRFPGLAVVDRVLRGQ